MIWWGKSLAMVFVCKNPVARIIETLGVHKISFHQSSLAS